MVKGDILGLDFRGLNKRHRMEYLVETMDHAESLLRENVSYTMNMEVLGLS